MDTRMDIKVEKKPERMKVSRKGAVVIPREIRERFGIKEGTEVTVLVRNGQIVLHPVPEDPIAYWAGRFKDGPSLTESLLEERRREAQMEEQKYQEWVARSERTPK